LTGGNVGELLPITMRVTRCLKVWYFSQSALTFRFLEEGCRVRVARSRRFLGWFGVGFRRTMGASVGFLSDSVSGSRAGLKPMQPMQLHWVPRLWGSLRHGV